MITDTMLVSFDRWTLRVRQGSSQRILLLLHGWTGDENSMSIFSRSFPDDAWVISPRAPYVAGPSGYSWRAPAPRGSWPSVDLLRASVNVLIDLLDRWTLENALGTAHVDVVGFSQGGAMALTLGALYPSRVQKLGILAGFAPQGIETVLKPGLLGGKHIFLAHGTLDEMVPIAMARQVLKLLETSGAQVSYCESQVGHKLSAECLKALGVYLKD